MYLVEIICIGNELLSGITLNTNAYWLAKKITNIGATVQRIVAIKDELNEIESIIRESLKRKPNMIITCGGLGPTYDDKTLLGISNGLNRKLVLNKLALNMIKESYHKRNLEVKINAARLKMAKIPEDSVPIYNPAGTAPAILINVNKTEIICLPGVPLEMKSIFEKKILFQIKKRIGEFIVKENNYHVSGVSEAMLSSTLTKIVNSYAQQDLYLKTHPQGYRNNVPLMRIQIISKGTNKKLVEKIVIDVSNQIIANIKKLKGTIKKKKNI